MLITDIVDGINSESAATQDTWGLEAGTAEWKYY